MKIGVVIIHALNTRSSRYILEVSRYWKVHNVHVFTSEYDRFPSGVKIHRIPVYGNFYLRETSFFITSSFLTKFYDFDVTMSQATRFFSPDICYMQFVYKNWAIMTGSYSFPNRIVSAVEGFNLRRCKKIIAMTNVVKNEIIKYYNIPDDKISVIYSGVDLKFFSPKNRKYRRKIRKSLGISDNEILICFAGNPYSRKGLNYLVKAIPLIREGKVMVMGRDLGNDRIINYKNLAKKLGVGDRLIYAGFRKDINKYFSASDVFVFPTLYEPFGLVILEAMASGLPVVVSANAGAAELIEDGKEGLLLKNPKNPREISERVNYLIENQNEMKRMGRNARRKAEKYTWEKTAREMEKIFKEVAEMKGL